MPLALDDLMPPPKPTSQRPLLGLTVLVVEDSRFASEAVRLLCLRSGARIRRADSLSAAHKHLAAYRPNVVIVDIGLPDGSGADLIDELTHLHSPVDCVIGMSGDSGARALSTAAGAHGFIEKPISNLGAFQTMVLDALARDDRPTGLRMVTGEHIDPDLAALHDDFAHVADILTAHDGEGMLDYIAQFLESVARTAGDAEIIEAAQSLARNRNVGHTHRADVARIAGLVQNRIAVGGAG